jgi:hypothetical protein
MNENESFMTASELCEADHPYDFAVANPRVEQVQPEANKFTLADLKNAFDLLQYVRDDNPDAAVIVQLMNEVSATATNPNHAKVASVGVLINAMIDGLKARIEKNKPVSA